MPVAAPFAAALACAAQLSGLALPPPSFEIAWHDARSDPSWCVDAGYSEHPAMVREADGRIRIVSRCWGMTRTRRGWSGAEVWAPAADTRVMVIEACRVLTVANGVVVPQFDPSRRAAREAQRRWCYAIGERAAAGACGASIP